MKRGARSQGYTIIEVLIVLGITVAMFSMAVIAFQGRHASAQFTQSVRDVETRLRDVMNEVNSGRFPADADFTCTANVSGITFSTADAPQGTNTGCMYLGKVLRFGSGGTCGNECMTAFTVAGKRLAGSGAPGSAQVTTLTQAMPQVAEQSGVVDLTDSYPFKYGLHTTNFWQMSGTISGVACPCSLGSMGFFLTPGKYDGNNDIISNSTRVDVVPIIGSTYADSHASAVSAVNTFNAANEAQRNPAEGFLVCLRDSSNRRVAGVIVGRNGRQGVVEGLLEDSLDAYLGQAKFGGRASC